MNNNEFFNSLDYFYIFLTLASCLFGFARGFIKDFFSTCAWFGSGFLSALVSPHFVTTLRSNYFQSDLLAKIAAFSISYIVILITLLLVISAISGKIKNSSLSGIDRALGSLFGLVRGVLILLALVMICLFFNLADENSKFAKESKITPSLIKIARQMMPKIIDQSDLTESYSEKFFKSLKEKEEPMKKSSVFEKTTPKDEKTSAIDRFKNYVSTMISNYERRNEAKDRIENKNRRALRKRDKDVEFGCLSLMQARAKRKTIKKAEKLRGQLEMRLDKRPG